MHHASVVAGVVHWLRTPCPRSQNPTSPYPPGPVPKYFDYSLHAPAALAGVPGLAGMQVAHYWLAAMLTGLATRVWPYNAVVYAGPQVR